MKKIMIPKTTCIFDRHCVYAASKGQGGDEWCYMRAFTITSTSCHAILPRSDGQLSDKEYNLLKNDLGLNIRSEEDVDLDVSWQFKEVNELKKLSNEELKMICRSYGCTYSNKKKDDHVKTVREGYLWRRRVSQRLRRSSSTLFFSPFLRTIDLLIGSVL